MYHADDDILETIFEEVCVQCVYSVCKVCDLIDLIRYCSISSPSSSPLLSTTLPHHASGTISYR